MIRGVDYQKGVPPFPSSILLLAQYRVGGEPACNVLRNEVFSFCINDRYNHMFRLTAHIRLRASSSRLVARSPAFSITSNSKRFLDSNSYEGRDTFGIRDENTIDTGEEE